LEEKEYEELLQELEHGQKDDCSCDNSLKNILDNRANMIKSLKKEGKEINFG